MGIFATKSNQLIIIKSEKCKIDSNGLKFRQIELWNLKMIKFTIWGGFGHPIWPFKVIEPPPIKSGNLRLRVKILV